MTIKVFDYLKDIVFALAILVFLKIFGITLVVAAIFNRFDEWSAFVLNKMEKIKG